MLTLPLHFKESQLQQAHRVLALIAEKGLTATEHALKGVVAKPKKEDDKKVGPKISLFKTIAERCTCFKCYAATVHNGRMPWRYFVAADCSQWLHHAIKGSYQPCDTVASALVPGLVGYVYDKNWTEKSVPIKIIKQRDEKPKKIPQTSEVKKGKTGSVKRKSKQDQAREDRLAIAKRDQDIKLQIARENIAHREMVRKEKAEAKDPSPKAGCHPKAQITPAFRAQVDEAYWNMKGREKNRKGITPIREWVRCIVCNGEECKCKGDPYAKYRPYF
jgi:hypothetical protein